MWPEDHALVGPLAGALADGQGLLQVFHGPLGLAGLAVGAAQVAQDRRFPAAVLQRATDYQGLPVAVDGGLVVT